MSRWPQSSDHVAFFPSDAAEPWAEQTAERVIPCGAPPQGERRPGRELHALQSRIEADQDELVRLGLDIASVGVGDGCVELEYCAADRAAAARMLTSRYGPAVCPVWLGESRIVEVPKVFGSWIAENTTLTVFYGLDAVIEQPVRVVALELPYVVIVTVLISRVVTGPVAAISAGRTTHSTIDLQAPLGDRVVLDAAAAPTRPRWS